MAAGGKGILFTVTDTQSGQRSLFKFEQYSTFEKRCKEKFGYPLGTDIVFELEDGDTEVDESAFECLDNTTKLKIRPKHGPTSSHPCGQKPDGEQEPRQKERTTWTWSNPKNMSGEEYVKEQLKIRGKHELKNILEESENRVVMQPLAIAVIGNSGVGKSLLINTLRGLHRSDDEGWAPVGETETTTECRAYKHPTYPNLVFWDVPGVGTKRFPREEYLSAIQFDRYDFYIICSSTRFTEDDDWLVKEVKKRHKKCYFLRTKVDQDIQNAKQTDRKFNEKEKLNEIKKYSQKNLSNEHKVFLINSFDKFQYEFHIFLPTLLDDASNEKNRLLTLGLISVSVEMIEKKAMYLKDEIWKTAVLSALGGAIPIRRVSSEIDAVLLNKEISKYQRQFELTDADIKKYAESVDLPESDFRKKCSLKLNFDVIYSRGVQYLIKSFSHEQSAADVFHITPFIGSLIGAASSYRTTGEILETILDDCRHDAVSVFMFVTKRKYNIH